MGDQINEHDQERFEDALPVFCEDSLPVFSENDTWHIYRVPNKLRNVNAAAYSPQLLSIGPLHHGDQKLRNMESHKGKYCDKFCSRFGKNRDQLKPFIEEHRKKILDCYADITIDKQKNIDCVFLVDACFIIELFLMNSEKPDYCYILRSQWMRKAVELELIMLENQLPYFLLEGLYDFAEIQLNTSSISHPRKEGHVQNLQQSSCLPFCCDHIIDIEEAESDPVDYDHPFLKLTCEFFKDYHYGNRKWDMRRVTKPKHFTDLVRQFMCPDRDKDMIWKDTIKNIYNVRKLTAAGVKFKPVNDSPRFFLEREQEAPKCNLKLTCSRIMELRLTQFCVKNDTECVVRNIMALEQFVYPDKAYICSYFLLMDELVDTVEDVDLLVENKVITNMLGSNEAVAKLVNRLCDHIMKEKSCYTNICKELNEHYENCWNRTVATLKRVYFKDLWTGSSTVVGTFVLIFSILGSIQSFK